MMKIWIINHTGYFLWDRRIVCSVVCFFALIAAVVPFWQQMALRALFVETWQFLPVLFVWNKNTAIFFQIYEEKCKNIVILKFYIDCLWDSSHVLSNYYKVFVEKCFKLNNYFFVYYLDFEATTLTFIVLFEWAIN